MGVPRRCTTPTWGHLVALHEVSLALHVVVTLHLVTLELVTLDLLCLGRVRRWLRQSTAVVAHQPPPRLYSKANDAEYTPTLTTCHALPWSPLRLHTTSPAALVTRSSPMSEPYMW